MKLSVISYNRTRTCLLMSPIAQQITPVAPTEIMVTGRGPTARYAANGRVRQMGQLSWTPQFRDLAL